ncbi:hypothetical protein GE09DRAFT_1159316 [Coniochaeta sp. 2T2.1]|nr:hypothetical protein GE09DRAFT_1159316 [Coniochaeta sp. 2T2.1]
MKLQAHIDIRRNTSFPPPQDRRTTTSATMLGTGMPLHLHHRLAGPAFSKLGRPPRLHGTTGHSKYTNSLSMEAHEGESTKQPQEALLTSERTPLPGQQGGVDCQNNVEDLTSADGPDQELLGACEAHVTSGAPVYHDQARDLDSVSEVSQYEDAHSDFVDE